MTASPLLRGWPRRRCCSIYAMHAVGPIHPYSANPPRPLPPTFVVVCVYAVYAVSSLDTGVPLRHRTRQRRRDVPGSCRARSPALHVGRRDRVASAAVAAVAAAVGRRRRSSPSAHAASFGLGPSRVAAAATRQRDEAPGVLPPPKGRRVRRLSPSTGGPR